MTSRSRKLLGIVVLLALVVPIVIDLLWVTDEERVETALDSMEEALEARDADAVIAWFEDDVPVRRPIQALKRGPLAESVRDFLSRLEKFSFKRDTMRLEFNDDGDVDVTTEGTGWCRFEGSGPFGIKEAPFRFEMMFTLRRSGDRFLLHAVDHVTPKPVIG